ncbi:DNA double-strand break repair nuclease NurA [Streptomyces sp. NPDC006140]|uniref:DNA double-strand break repair nuclease NurA n=1 Tax=Streptomyces sp. NPDC006140 TaxID=3154579 RepID=UPI0033C38084
MRFSVDAWDPTYGTSANTDLGDSTARVEPDVELPAASWHPIGANSGAATPTPVLFVDGIRRIDARLWINEPPTVNDTAATSAVPGICASYAAGVVCCTGSSARLSTTEVRRGLFTASEHAEDVHTRAGNYRLQLTASEDGDALTLALQRQLGEAEVMTAIAARTANVNAGLAKDDDLLVIDGPLRGRQHLPRAIGFIKSHRAEYLPALLHAVIGTLESGQRTPVFRMGTSWDRHAWYLRLPCGPGAPWAGIVRVECSADLSTTAAIGLANKSQTTLCRYASTEYKDKRAPQNLYPIGGLERQLRRRLGDPALLYRALREAAALRL